MVYNLGNELLVVLGHPHAPLVDLTVEDLTKLYNRNGGQGNFRSTEHRLAEPYEACLRVGIYHPEDVRQQVMRVMMTFAAALRVDQLTYFTRLGRDACEYIYTASGESWIHYSAESQLQYDDKNDLVGFYRE